MSAELGSGTEWLNLRPIVFVRTTFTLEMCLEVICYYYYFFVIKPVSLLCKHTNDWKVCLFACLYKNSRISSNTLSSVFLFTGHICILRHFTGSFLTIISDIFLQSCVPALPPLIKSCKHSKLGPTLFSETLRILRYTWLDA